MGGVERQGSYQRNNQEPSSHCEDAQRNAVIKAKEKGEVGGGKKVKGVP
jgi:hypothetical protein